MKIEAKFTINPSLFNITETAIQKALYIAITLVKDDAKILSPVDKGDLVNSITELVGKNDAIIYSNLIYAIYQEFGTKRMMAQPFLRPALFDNKDNIVAIFKRVMDGDL